MLCFIGLIWKVFRCLGYLIFEIGKELKKRFYVFG